MRTFDEFPESSTCPICGTNEIHKKSVLIPIAESNKSEDNICEAQPFHEECILNSLEKLWFFKDRDFFILPLK